MNRKLTARSSLENLRREAKRWLTALRANDSAALKRLRSAHPGASTPPGLRDVQHALAREYGLPNWAAFKDSLAEIALAHSSREKLIAEFLEHSCIHYGVRPSTGTWDRSYFDAPSRWQYAARILERHPDIASHSIHTAAVAGNLTEVERILTARPEAANEKAGPSAWEPLLYVCYGRLPIESVAANSVAIASRLLDAGANVNVPMIPGDTSFLPLTGAIGSGEFSQPPHAQAAALAELLIDRGADPYSPQVLYNTSLETDDVFWWNFLYERSVQRNEAHKWTAAAPEWPKTGMLNYLLGNVVSRNAIERAKWLLARGADPSTTHFYSKRRVHTEAVLFGFTEMAGLLESHGYVPESLNRHEAFQAACMGLDRDTAKALVLEDPAHLRDGSPLIRAAERDLVDVATLLLDLGMSPNVHDSNNFHPLHAAAASDSVRVGALLIERGAEIDPVETRFKGVPLGWALHGERQGMIEMLGALSRDPGSLAAMGNLERLREVFAADPGLARQTDPNSSLFAYLQGDEDVAMEVAEFLLAHGADPRLKNKHGVDAIECLEKRGLESVAKLLRSRILQKQ
jgi:ankyrin repeat protein